MRCCAWWFCHISKLRVTQPIGGASSAASNSPCYENSKSPASRRGSQSAGWARRVSTVGVRNYSVSIGDTYPQLMGWTTALRMQRDVCLWPMAVSRQPRRIARYSFCGLSRPAGRMEGCVGLRTPSLGACWRRPTHVCRAQVEQRPFPHDLRRWERASALAGRYACTALACKAPEGRRKLTLSHRRR